MKPYKFLPKANGFSVIEVMVVIGIMSVVMLAFMQMTVSGQSDVAALQSKMGQLVLAQDIRFKTSQSNLCMAGLKSTAYKGGTTPMDFEFDLGGGRVVKKDADLNSTDNVVVKQFQLVNPTTVTTLTKLPGSSVTATGGSVISGNLEIVTAGGRGASREFKRLNIGRINLLVNNASTIVDCNTVDVGGGSSNETPTNDPVGPCTAFPTASDAYGTPSWAAEWPKILSGVCGSFTYPMSKSQTVSVCGGTLWKKGYSVTSSGCGVNKVSPPAIKIVGFGPFTSQSACESAAPGFGMQVIQPNESGGMGTRYDVCIGGHWISMLDTDTHNAVDSTGSGGGGGSGDGGDGGQ